MVIMRVLYTRAVDANGELQLTVPQWDWALMDDTTGTKGYRFLANWATPQVGYSTADVVSAVFKIDRIVPEVTNIALSWMFNPTDALLSVDEMFDEATITINTLNVEDGQNVIAHFNSTPADKYYGEVVSNRKYSYSIKN